MHPHLHTAAISHPGMSGKSNEDRYTIATLKPATESEPPVLLAIIADGIGGHRAGEIAAEITVNSITQYLTNADLGNPTQALQSAIIKTSQKIYAQAQSNLAQHGMGATCACCLIIGDRLYVAYVGDSRIYFLRNGQIRQISIDHTWVQEALDNELLTPAQARNHPYAHVIRRFLGSEQTVEPDLRLQLSKRMSDEQASSSQGLPLLPGDQILLCSDGLTDLVDELEIRDALSQSNQQRALKQLVQLANQRGGHDNISIIALQVPEPELEQTKEAPTRTRYCIRLSCIIISLAILLGAIALLAGLLWFWDDIDHLVFPPQTATYSIATFQPIQLQNILRETQASPTNTAIHVPVIATEALISTPPIGTRVPAPNNTSAP